MSNVTAREELIHRITKQKPTHNQPVKKHLDKMNELVNQDLTKICDENATTTDDLNRLKEYLNQFGQLCEFPDLSKKNIVVIGGKFSAGKSTFINNLIDQKLLVTEIDPTTSIPTYLFKADNNEIVALNQSNAQSTLTEEEFASLTHDEKQNHGSEVGVLLKSIFITVPNFHWENLAFLDTPGYSKPKESQNQKNDADIAYTHLTLADNIIWLVSAEDGVIKEDDLKFLEKLESTIPKLVLITKADIKTEGEIKDIIDLTKKTLENRNITTINVLPVSRKKSSYPLDDVLSDLDNWNQQITSRDFGKHIFDKLEALKDLSDSSKIHDIESQFFESYNQIAETLGFNKFEVPTNHLADILNYSLEDRLAIARSSDISEDEAKILAKDEDILVRVALASNPNINESIFEILNQEENQEITCAILSSQKLDIDSLKNALSDVDTKLREAVAKNPNLTEEIQLILAKDIDSNVRIALAKNAYITEKTQLLLINDAHQDVKNIVAKNPNLNERVKSILVEQKRQAQQKIEELKYDLSSSKDKLYNIQDNCQRRLDNAHDTPKKMFESFDSWFDRKERLVDKAVEANRRDEREINQLKQKIESLEAQIKQLSE